MKKLLLHQLYIRVCFAGTYIRYQAGLGEEVTIAPVIYIGLCFTGTDIRYQAGLGEEVTIAPVIYPTLFYRHRH